MLSSARILLRHASTVLFLVTLLALSAPASFALPITGGVLFTGGLVTDTGDLENATELSFLNSTVLFASGDFAANGVSSGTPVTFIADPLMLPPMLMLPLELWQIADFEFQLTGFTVEEQSASILTVSGTGTITDTSVGSDLDSVEGFWRMTSQQPGLGLSGQTIFSFSSASVAVPEPSSLLLMTLGMTGLALATRQHGRRGQGRGTR